MRVLFDPAFAPDLAKSLRFRSILTRINPTIHTPPQNHPRDIAEGHRSTAQEFPDKNRKVDNNFQSGTTLPLVDRLVQSYPMRQLRVHER